MRNGNGLFHRGLESRPRFRTFDHFPNGAHLFYDDTVVPFDPALLADHHRRHQADFVGISMTDYEKLADQFITKPATSSIRECTRRVGGDRIRYDTITTEFAVQSRSGIVRTYYKPRPCRSIPAGLPRVRCHGFPTNEDYFKDACVSVKW